MWVRISLQKGHSLSPFCSQAVQSSEKPALGNTPYGSTWPRGQVRDTVQPKGLRAMVQTPRERRAGHRTLMPSMNAEHALLFKRRRWKLLTGYHARPGSVKDNVPASVLSPTAQSGPTAPHPKARSLANISPVSTDCGSLPHTAMTGRNRQVSRKGRDGGWHESVTPPAIQSAERHPPCAATFQQKP